MVVERGVIGPPFTAEEYRRRIERVRSLMASKGMSTLLINTPENIFYLSGYQTPGYYAYQALVIPEVGDPRLVVRKLEESNVGRSWIKAYGAYLDTEDPVDTTVAVLHELDNRDMALGVEEESWFLTVAAYRRIRDALVQWTTSDASGLVETLRVVKSAAEIAYIRQACLVAEASMRAAVDAAQVGVTENHVASEAYRAGIMAGGEYPSLPHFVTSGENSRLCHATWSGRELQEGDLLFLELSGVVTRYSGALMRSVYLGDRLPSQLQQMADAAQAGMDAVVASLRPGVPASEPALQCRLAMEEWGFGLAKRIGYSIGLNFPPDWGEGHILSLKESEQQLLQPDMVFHVPSTIRVDGAPIGISETLRVTETGCEVLTAFEGGVLIKTKAGLLSAYPEGNRYSGASTTPLQGG